MSGVIGWLAETLAQLATLTGAGAGPAARPDWYWAFASGVDPDWYWAFTTGINPDWYWAAASGVRPDWYWAASAPASLLGVRMPATPDPTVALVPEMPGTFDTVAATATPIVEPVDGTVTSAAQDVPAHLASTVVAAAPPTQPMAQVSVNTGTELRDVLLAVMGTFLLVILAARALAAFADEHYGKIVMLVLAAVPIAGMCYFPAQVTDLLRGLFTLFFGGG